MNYFIVLNMNPEKQFKKREEYYQQKQASYNRRLGKLSWARLIVFLSGLVAIYMSTAYNATVLIATVALFLVAFLWVVYLHHIVTIKRDKAERLRLINHHEQKALNHDFSAFRDGEKYTDYKHDFIKDLNIFGRHSVFQLINRTVTEPGEILLAEWLSYAKVPAQLIQQRQKAIQEIAAHLNYIQKFIQEGSHKRFRKSHYKRLYHWAEASTIPVGVERILAPLFSVLTVVLTGLIIAGFVYWSAIIFWILAGLGITGLYAKKVKKQHQQLNKISPALKIMESLSSRINKLKIKEEYLKPHYQVLKQDERQQALKKLTKILQSFDVRLNVVAAFLLNSLFLWDLHQMVRLSNWKKNYSSILEDKLQAIFHFDAVMSLANFAYSYPEYHYPKVLENAENQFILQGEDCKHILLPGDERVGNPVSMDKRGMYSIITGANMAGKSTYLRTIGVNMVLAAAGLPLDCKSFVYTPVRIISSLTTKDSLVKNESFFYAEIKRLQYIIQNLEKGEQLFCLLDEILKGTNSKDKQTGSIKLLRKLIHLNSNGIVATHDLQIGEMEQEFPDRIQNHRFEVEIKDDQLYFDYKLKEGIARSLNASFLMRKMGITEE